MDLESTPESQIVNVSYSCLQSFRNCRRYTQFNYIDGLVPLAKPSHALSYGTIIHKALDIWHSSRDFNSVLAFLSEEYKDRTQNQSLKEDFLTAKQMMRGYASRYASDDFEVVSLEKDFVGPITDMDTLEPLPGVQMVGRVDGIVKINGEHYLLEHKTASKVDSCYLDKLWSDFQIILYCYYINKVFGITCVGVLYNILAKPKLSMKPGESETDYQERLTLAAAKNKSGKSNVQRKMPETDQEYEERLAEFFKDRYSYHREKIYISKGLMRRVVTEISEVTKSYMACMQRGKFYMNTDHCFRYGSPCQYYAICRSDDNPNIIENFYQKRDRISLALLEDYNGPAL